MVKFDQGVDEVSNSSKPVHTWQIAGTIPFTIIDVTSCI